ncbi:hypothetical protein BASA50_000299 [Batrachochytrium salamandrivorans]|uniref:Uncharacterized protein n=1 Tax=Batrachochytrium salamandrivorans TaxID=1357716 RepID=A0ABQ8EUS6_9FUNG|nr:hypothetical protein BASA50_000299 [Batrachochytrium salamandrivorans]
MSYDLHRRFGAAVSKSVNSVAARLFLSLAGSEDSEGGAAATSREVEFPQTTKELKQLLQSPSQMVISLPHLHQEPLQSSADPSEESLGIVMLMQTAWTQSHSYKGRETSHPLHSGLTTDPPSRPLSCWCIP